MNLFKTLTVSILTSSLLIACSNDKEQILDSAPKQVTLSLNLPKMAATRGLDDKTADGDKVTMEGTVMVYAKQSETGAIVNTYTLDVSRDFTGSCDTQLQRTIEVNGSATYIEVEGNIDGERGRTAAANTRQGGSKTSAVRVTGGNTINSIRNTSTCEIVVAPEMARFEVIGELGETVNIKNPTISGYYLNNIKENRNSNNLTKLAGDEAFTAAYRINGTHSFLYDEGDVNTIPTRNAYGYNFYPQTHLDASGDSDKAPATTKEQAAKYHPHMIIKISYMKNEELVSNKWLNIIALKDKSGKYFESFEKGKVYQLNLSSLKEIIDVENPPVTDMPDPDAVGVEISVSVKGWEVVTVTPEV